MHAHASGLLTLSFCLAASMPSVLARDAASQAPDTDFAKGPMRVALLVDTSDGVGAAMTQIRSAVASFADALPSEHELMLVSIGRHTQVRVQPTTDRKKVKDSAAGLTVDHGPTTLMDSLMEIDERFLRRDGDRWGAMVVITGNGNESSIRADDKDFNNWLASVSRRRISIDAIVLQFQANGMPEVIARAATRAAAGRMDSTTMAGALADKLKTIAERLGTEHPSQR